METSLRSSLISSELRFYFIQLPIITDIMINICLSEAMFSILILNKVFLVVNISNCLVLFKIHIVK